MILGHEFSAADDKAGAAPVVLLAEGLWRTSFGADPGVVGRTIQLNGKPYTVQGVTAIVHRLSQRCRMSGFLSVPRG